MSVGTKYPKLSRHLRKGYRRQRVFQIEKQAYWTTNDINLLLAFSRQLNLENCEVEVPFAILVALAFDVRTPDHKAAELQQEVKERAKTNQFTTNKKRRR